MTAAFSERPVTSPALLTAVWIQMVSLTVTSLPEIARMAAGTATLERNAHSDVPSSVKEAPQIQK